MRAALGDMRSGMGGFRRDMRDTRGEVGMLDRQLRAFGTTLRYAFAGSTIFGGVALVGQLNQIQQQLGLVSAISPTAFRGVALTGDALAKFGEQAEDAALRSNTGINDFNAGLVNLVSTVQNVPEDQVVPMLEAIAKTARLSMTPVDEATKGITGLMVAFDKEPSLANVQRFLAEYQRLIFTVPGGAAAGPQIIQQLPQLAAVSRLANVNPEQMFGVLNTVLRAGGSPATGARGLQYLIQGLAQPPSEQATKALAGVGITPDFTQRAGGIASLVKLIDTVRSLGVTGNTGVLRGMSEEMLTQLEGTEGADALTGLGISGAGADFARKAVGRIHGVRALILLAAQEDQMIEDLRMMTSLGRNTAEQTRELRESWQRYEDQAQLQKVGLAVNAMAVDIAQVFEPLLNFAGRGAVKAQGIVDKNPEAAVAALVGGAGLLTAGRMAGRRFGGLRGLGPAHAAYSQLTAMGDPDSARGSSPANPLFVAIAYSLAGWGRNASMVPAPNSPGPIPRGSRAGNLARTASLIAAPAALAFGLNEAFGNPILGQFGIGKGGFDRIKQAKKMAPLYNMLIQRDQGFHIPVGGLFGGGGFTIGGGGRKHKLSPAQERILERVEKGYLSQQNADRMLRRISTPEQLRAAGINVKGKAEITVRVEQPGVRPTRSKVIVDFAPDFTGTAPQTRGQKTTRRGG